MIFLLLVCVLSVNSFYINHYQRNNLINFCDNNENIDSDKLKNIDNELNNLSEKIKNLKRSKNKILDNIKGLKILNETQINNEN